MLLLDPADEQVAIASGAATIVLGGRFLRNIAGAARIFGQQHGALDRRVALCLPAGDFGFVIGAGAVEVHRHRPAARHGSARSEEHTSELQSLMRISYAVFCLKKKNKTHKTHTT